MSAALRTKALSWSRTEIENGRGLRRHLTTYWLSYALALLTLLYVLTFARGLAWQWRGILTASEPAVPAAGAAQPARTDPATAGGPGAVSLPAQPGAQAAPQPAAQARSRTPLAPSNEPPPRNTTDQHGVFYDAQGVAVSGIDADPGGVYNVPPGRQVRIGGPTGNLYDVLPDGKISPASRVKEWP